MYSHPQTPPSAPKGRGAGDNPPNRFQRIWYEPSEDEERLPDEERPAPVTQFFRDEARSLLAHNDSPDVGFDTSINVYRGCEHGCIYCYARPTHEYLGFSAGLDFETKIMVKEDAPELLRRELSAKKWVPRVIAMSGVTDCYQPIERKLGLTRRCLEVLADFRNPVAIVTKNHLVTRDIDVLGELASHRAAAVFISITTLDSGLGRMMEPRASTPLRRLKAIEALATAGIPVGVLVCPVVPGLTDHEMPAILQAAADAGAYFSGYNMLRLPYAVKNLFEAWLDANLPHKKNKVLNKIRDVRGGALNDSQFGSRMAGEGVFAEQVAALYRIARTRAGIARGGPQLSTDAFRCPVKGQLQLFE
jgi:DNA repair photolyase